MAEYINHRDIFDLQDLLDAISEGAFDCGRTPDTVVFNEPLRLTLVEETLSDGSTVFDIKVSKAPVWGTADEAPRHENGWTP